MTWHVDEDQYNNNNENKGERTRFNLYAQFVMFRLELRSRFVKNHLEKSRDSKIRRLFDFREEKLFSLFLMKRLGKLISFWGQMVLRMKLIAKKELNLPFQMTPSRILSHRYFWSYDFLNLFLFFRIFPKNKILSWLKYIKA